MRKPRTRILLASGARARWVERAIEGGDLATLGEVQADVAHARHGPPGVTYESASGGLRHGIGESREPERRREAFAEKIAELLNPQDARGEFDRLALVAPARLLRAIRERLSPSARSKICFELAKDLTKHPNHELGEWLHSPELV